MTIPGQQLMTTGVPQGRFRGVSPQTSAAPHMPRLSEWRGIALAQWAPYGRTKRSLAAVTKKADGSRA